MARCPWRSSEKSNERLDRAQSRAARKTPRVPDQWKSMLALPRERRGRMGHVRHTRARRASIAIGKSMTGLIKPDQVKARARIEYVVPYLLGRLTQYGNARERRRPSCHHTYVSGRTGSASVR